MPRVCTICVHPSRVEIDSALVRFPLRDIARRWRVSKDALARHKGHIRAVLQAARQERELASLEAIHKELTSIYGRAMGILDRAEAANDPRTALTAVRELRGLLGTMAELFVNRDLERRVEALERSNPETETAGGTGGSYVEPGKSNIGKAN